MNKLKYINLTVLFLSISFLIISCSSLSPQKPSKLTHSQEIALLKKQFKRSKDLNILTDALKDEDPIIQIEAARMLGETSDPGAVEPLILALKTDKHYGVREDAAFALGKIKDLRAVEPLIQALEDQDSGVQRLAIFALGELKDKRAVEPLTRILREHRENLVRSTALESLDKIGWKPSSTKDAKVSDQKKSKLPKIWLFAVGISQYQFKDIDLVYAAKDAKDVFTFMISKDGGKIQNQRAKLLINHQATRANIIGEFTRLMRRTMPKDLVIAYIATHGLPDPIINELQFVAYDTDLNNLLATGVSQLDITRALHYGKAKKVLFVLDTCHSGQIGSQIMTAQRGIYVSSVNRLLNQLTKARDGLTILSASSAAETSEEGKQYGGGHGVFTFYLLEALKGNADEDSDKIITIRELFDYVYNNVAERTEGKQHPELKGIYDNELPIIELE